MGDEQREILPILEELLQEEDILAVMLCRKGFDGIKPDPGKFKLSDAQVWTALEGAMDDVFSIISKFTQAGLDKIYFELGQYEVMFFILPEDDVALVAVIPALANKGLLEVEMENARREIVKKNLENR